MVHRTDVLDGDRLSERSPQVVSTTTSPRELESCAGSSPRDRDLARPRARVSRVGRSRPMVRGDEAPAAGVTVVDVSLRFTMTRLAPTPQPSTVSLLETRLRIGSPGCNTWRSVRTGRPSASRCLRPRRFTSLVRLGRPLESATGTPQERGARARRPPSASACRSIAACSSPLHCAAGGCG